MKQKYLSARALPAAALVSASALAALLPLNAARAQVALSVEATSDSRERGLSWSDGQAALKADASLSLSNSFAIDVEARTLRDSARHGGSDIGVTVSPHYKHDMGGFNLTAGVNGYGFSGEGKLAFVEAEGTIAYTLGPAQVAAGISYAPRQKAIGSDNLYLDASAAVGVPGTPFTIYGGGGYTSGSTRNAERAARLRPGGDYWDHYVGIEHSLMNLSMGVLYTDTTVDKQRTPSPYDDRHAGAKVSAYARLRL